MGYLDPNHAKLEDLMDIGTGPTLFVDTVAGSATGTGRSWEGAYSTMALAFADLLALHTATAKSGDNATIYARGDIREQLDAPLGVSGVRIIGAQGGNTRHDNGTRWREPASPTATTPLLRLREQGWEVHNILFVPKSDDAAITLHRAEDATYPDGSHAIIRGCKFSGAGIGVEDIGGNHHVLIERCEFVDMTKAITTTSTGIAVPLRNIIQDCVFIGNTNDIAVSFSYGIIRRNQFLTAGSGATNKVISTTYVSVQGGNNHVVHNVFSNSEVQIAPGNGFTGAADDVWANYVNDQAALAIGQPA